MSTIETDDNVLQNNLATNKELYSVLTHISYPGRY